MATVPVVFTQSMPRNELEEIFKTPRRVHAFEDLFKDVRITLPDAIGNASQDAGSVLVDQSFAARVPMLPPSATASEDNTQRILAAQIFGA